MARKPEEMISLVRKLMLDEGCITIAPRASEFRGYERDFLEGLRRIPAEINAPPGVNPYTMALGRPGRWLMVWIPE